MSCPHCLLYAHRLLTTHAFECSIDRCLVGPTPPPPWQSLIMDAAVESRPNEVRSLTAHTVTSAEIVCLDCVIQPLLLFRCDPPFQLVEQQQHRRVVEQHQHRRVVGQQQN